MNWTSYAEFFTKATGERQPFPYQERLATGVTLPRLLNVPTGAGKTAAAALGWLWRRRCHSDPAIRQATPRRLVYCLPMRILVEQTQVAIITFLANLGISDIPVQTLLGGEADDGWTVQPEQDAILIGTQDMLLSRALNRGYGLNRFRWPQAFGLLHNDAMWVFDEVQLFGVGLPTTAQLEAFRNRYGTYGPTNSLWMSATLQPDWLQTVDFPAPPDTAVLRLGDADLQFGGLKERLHANKPLHALTLTQNTKTYARELAAAVTREHRPGTLTLVIVNTVKRAQAVYAALATKADRLLLHSRFRPAERAERVAKLKEALPAEGRIVVSTSVVEAGVDISARALFTELAPWASLVQRFGRCNRRGEQADAVVYWLDVDDKQAAPYRPEELAGARELLRQREGQSMAPALLPAVSLPIDRGDVIRRRDLLDLFDTTPDLSGNDIDVSRFIRDGDDHDVLLCWRPMEKRTADDMGEPKRSELCPAPIGEVWESLKTRTAWVFDHLDDKWRPFRPDSLRPGLVLVLPTTAGGYSSDMGWDPDSTAEVTPVPVEEYRRPEGTRSDPLSDQPTWVLLTDHTEQVVKELERLLSRITTEPASEQALRRAARWHDAGKAHETFQTTLLDKKPEPGTPIWAKAPTKGRRHGRPQFRHELASALALLQQSPAEFLPAYLVGAHHGRVRLSIRALDREKKPDGDQQGGRYALGVWDADPLGPADLGGGELLPAVRLDLGPMEMGIVAGSNQAGSWTERAIALREKYGPFRLAFLEALLRAADVRASMQSRKEEAP